MQKVQEMWVQSLVRENLLEEEMATHSSILAWKIPCTEEPGGLQFMWSQRVGHDLATKQLYLSYPVIVRVTFIERCCVLDPGFHANSPPSSVIM